MTALPNIFLPKARTMMNQKHFLCFLSFVLLIHLSIFELSESKELVKVKVGVVLDSNSAVGRIAKRWISMALRDFYAVNSNYRTRLNLLSRDSHNDVVLAASAALDLMKNEEVHAIIGPQRSTEAKFVVNLGAKAKVPIISFSATNPTLSPTENEFFIRSTHDDSCQVKALAALVQAYGWREIVLIHEATDYGNGLIPYLTDALQEVNTRVNYRSVISPNSDDNEILMELKKLKENRTTIFLVHMTASLGSQLFVQAKIAGMMRDGFAWIVTEGLSTLLDPVRDSKDTESMRGVLGLRPHIPMSKRLEHFRSRWFKSLDKPNRSTGGLNLFGLRAYDTVWAIAMAVEKAGIENSSFLKPNTINNGVDLAALGKFKMGPKLLDTLLNTTFQGLSGYFHLVKGQLEPSAYEIFNVYETTYETIIGYWTKEKGLLSSLSDNGKTINSTSVNQLMKKPIWPGNTVEQPKKLRIGVPVVREGFTEFVKVEWQQNNCELKPKFSGFAIELFLEVLDVLEFPLPYEFVPFHNNCKSAGSYNDLLYNIKLQKFDAVVGDIAIVANRSTFVDFTLPYSESGVSMIVSLKDDRKKNLWIFLKPLSLELWLTTGAAFIFTGLVVWVLEHRTNAEFRGPPYRQVGTIFWFSFSTLVFAHRERVVNNLSRFVLIIWVFVVLILTQSYTASLTSMLTVQRLQPSFTDVKEIQKHGLSVGYQNHSFVKDLLTEQLHFDEHKLKPYSTAKEYHDALSRGAVAAIFDEIPYIKLFLANYCSRYTMIGPTYKTDGFGFAFPQGSPLVSYISRAILNVTEDKEKMEEIVNRTFGNQATCENQVPSLSSDGLGVYSFGGLFIISGVASMSSLLIYIVNFVWIHWPELKDNRPGRSILSKFMELMKNFDQKDLSSHPLKRGESGVHPEPRPQGNGASLHVDAGTQNIPMNPTEGAENNVAREDDEAHSPVVRDIDVSRMS